MFGSISVALNIPSQYKSFLGIPYATNPQYANSIYEMLVLLIMGIFFLALALGMFIASLHSKPINSSQSAKMFFAKPSISTEKKYCRYCGTENNKDAIFCEKCGKRIAETEPPRPPTY